MEVHQRLEWIGEGLPLSSTEEEHLKDIQTDLREERDIVAYGNKIWKSAIERGYTKIVSVLLEAGYPIHTLMYDSYSWGALQAIHFACRLNNIDMVALLLDHGADIHRWDSNDRSPLMLAISGYETLVSEREQLDLVKLLLARGAKVNEVSPVRRFTPLHTACSYERESIFRLLVEQGANVNAVTQFGYHVLHYLCGQIPINFSMVTFVVDHGVNLHARTLDGHSVFQLGVFSGDNKLIHYLATQGANPHRVRDHPYYAEVYRKNYPALRTILWCMIAKRRADSSWIKLIPTELLRYLRSFLCVPATFDVISAFQLYW